jgi:hypothetical protein
LRVAPQRKLGTSFHFWKAERALDALNGRDLELLEAVDFKEFADTVTVELPCGRKRALAIGTTLALEPELMLRDEISEGLAPVIVQAPGSVIRRLKEKGYTIILVEQNFRFAALFSQAKPAAKEVKASDGVVKIGSGWPTPATIPSTPSSRPRSSASPLRQERQDPRRRPHGARQVFRPSEEAGGVQISLGLLPGRADHPRRSGVHAPREE